MSGNQTGSVNPYDNHVVRVGEVYGSIARRYASMQANQSNPDTELARRDAHLIIILANMLTPVPEAARESLVGEFNHIHGKDLDQMVAAARRITGAEAHVYGVPGQSAGQQMPLQR